MPHETDFGVWFRSAVSGLWYRDHKAAGTISEVRVDGKLFTAKPDPFGEEEDAVQK